MRLVHLLITSVFLTYCCPVARSDRVDEDVESEMKQSHLPGLALAVTQGGKVIRASGYGLANVELDVPVTPGTVFQIQSVTKQFVATAIMMLAEAGKLAVTDKVSAHLADTPEVWKDITLRHLLTHTSGIKDFINEPTASLRIEVTDEEVFQETARRPLNFQPGEKYAYSNSNYHLLAMVIRKLTGQSYGEFLKARVFEPLGMGQTRVVSWVDLVPHRAAGYLWRNGHLRNGQFIAESILSYGGGGLLSTVTDMAKWELALRGETLLKRAALEEMWAPTKLNSGGFSNYGFGWGIEGQKPHRAVQHSGGHVTGFTSYIIHYLDDDLGIIVLINGGLGDPSRMAHRIAEFYVPDLKPKE
jgi:CubicO group peptidase (beta-lactamase class C family)